MRLRAEAAQVVQAIQFAIDSMALRRNISPHTAFRVSLPDTQLGQLVANAIPAPHLIVWSPKALARSIETGEFAFYLWPIEDNAASLTPDEAEQLVGEP